VPSVRNAGSGINVVEFEQTYRRNVTPRVTMIEVETDFGTMVYWCVPIEMVLLQLYEFEQLAQRQVNISDRSKFSTCA